jgi:hypothetical protein
VFLTIALLCAIIIIVKERAAARKTKDITEVNIMKDIKFERNILEWCINFDLESLECFYTTTDWIIENINKELAEYAVLMQM